MTQPRRSMRQVREGLGRRGAAGAGASMFDETDDVAIRGIAVRQYIREHLSSTPDAVFEAECDEPGLPRVALRMNRGYVGPVLYDVADRALYVLVEGLCGATGEAHAFWMTVYLDVPDAVDIEYHGGFDGLAADIAEWLDEAGEDLVLLYWPMSLAEERGLADHLGQLSLCAHQAAAAATAGTEAYVQMLRAAATYD